MALVIIPLSAAIFMASLREVHSARTVAPPGGRFVPAGDVALFVQELGPVDGVPVLLVHGTGAWSETWRDTMTRLAQAGFRAIAVDLPPFGYSDRPATAAYDKHAQGKRIVAALDGLGIDRAILVGHSFGGGPTVEAALLASDRVRALVLVDAALSVREAGAQAPAPSGAGLLAIVPLRDALVATFLTNPLFTRKLLQTFVAHPGAATDARVAVYQRPLNIHGSTHAIGQWLPALLAPASAAASEDPASYRGLTMPVFIIWGDLDTITPLGQGERLAKITPGAQLSVMRNVGHIPQIEDAARFNELLASILLAVNSRSRNEP